MKSKWYTIASFWFLAVGAGTLINIFLICLFGSSLPIGSHIGWNFLFIGAQANNTMVPFAILTIFVSIPFFFLFWKSFKSWWAMFVGMLYYALDSFKLIFDIIVFDSIPLRIFLAISLAIHVVGIALLVIATFIGYNSPKYQNNVRTLYVACSPTCDKNIRFACYLNGAFMCTLTAGETRIVVIDRNHQRLYVNSDSLSPENILLPPGRDNVSVTVSVAYTNNGTSITITPTNPTA